MDDLNQTVDLDASWKPVDADPSVYLRVAVGEPRREAPSISDQKTKDHVADSQLHGA